MHRRKIVTGILALTMVVIGTACGNGSSNAEPTETAAPVEAEAEKENTGVVEQAAAEVQEQETVEDETAEAVTEADEETATDEIQDKDKLTSVELENIVQQYDEVLSNYDLECYFGYNKPDDGWELEAGYDGREQGKESEQLSQGNETLHIESFESEPVEIISVFDENDNEVEVQADTYEYQCRYNDAIRAFCETGEWEEPERCEKPYHMGMSYCIDRKPAGKIDTPYGEGTLYSAVYECFSYEEWNEEGAYWEQIDESSRYWYRREGMLIEINDYFVQVELSNLDWYVWEWEEEKSGDRLLDIEYTGRLEELLPQMFEVK